MESNNNRGSMKENANEKIVMLQYRIKRYRAMRNGTMCQALNGQLKKILLKSVKTPLL